MEALKEKRHRQRMEPWDPLLKVGKKRKEKC